MAEFCAAVVTLTVLGVVALGEKDQQWARIGHGCLVGGGKPGSGQRRSRWWYRNAEPSPMAAAPCLDRTKGFRFAEVEELDHQRVLTRVGTPSEVSDGRPHERLRALREQGRPPRGRPDQSVPPRPTRCPSRSCAWLGLVYRAHRAAGGTGVPPLHELATPTVQTQKATVAACVSRVISLVQT